MKHSKNFIKSLISILLFSFGHTYSNIYAQTIASYDKNSALNYGISGSYSSAFGVNILVNNSGDYNTATGSYAMNKNTTGNRNTATGASALYYNTTGAHNVANGCFALSNNTTGGFNTGIGYSALSANTTGSNNVAIGGSAMVENKTGAYNVAVGVGALSGGSSGSRNTAVGDNAITYASTGDDNTAMGCEALFFNTSGNKNTIVGSQALRNNSTGSSNTAIGYSTMNKNTTGVFNTAVGGEAFKYNVTGGYNAAFGHASLSLNTSGYYNTAIGVGALKTNASGNSNTALGYSADVSSNNLTNATAIGSGAKVTENNAVQLGSSNVTKIFAGVGTTATLITGGLQIMGGTPGVGKVLTSNANGVATWQLPANGVNWSLTGNTGTVDVNNFVGTIDNVALNFRVNNVRSGRIDPLLFNTFYGYQSGFSNNNTGHNNIAIGSLTLNNNTDGNYNIGVGDLSLSENTTGTGNVANGYAALLNNMEGINNTAVGNAALAINITGSNNTTLGANTDVKIPDLFNATAIGAGTVVNESNKIRLGDANVTVIEGQVEFTKVSDGQFKTNVEDGVKGLDFINRLRPVVYNFDTKKFTEFLTQNMSDSAKNKYLNNDFTVSSSIRHSGFIAQEVEKAARESGYDFNGVHVPKDENDYYSLAYAELVVPLVKGMQEQQKMIEEQQGEIKELKELVKKLTSQPTSTTSTTGTIKNTTIELSNNNAVVLNQNVPNPFSTQTTIDYVVPSDAKKAEIVFYKSNGQRINSVVVAGKGQLKVFSKNLTNGNYSYTLVIDGKNIETKQMVVLQ